MINHYTLIVVFCLSVTVLLAQGKKLSPQQIAPTFTNSDRLNLTIERDSLNPNLHFDKNSILKTLAHKKILAGDLNNTVLATRIFRVQNTHDPMNISISDSIAKGYLRIFTLPNKVDPKDYR